MKLSTLLGALLLSVTPVFADDYLYLKCEESIELDVLHAQTSKFIKKGTKSRFVVYGIAIKDKTIKGIALDERVIETYDVVIDDDQLTYSGTQDVVDGDSSFQLMIDLKPPFDLVSKGRFISNELPVIVDWKNKGLCKKVDASVFEKALKETES